MKQSLSIFLLFLLLISLINRSNTTEAKSQTSTASLMQSTAQTQAGTQINSTFLKRKPKKTSSIQKHTKPKTSKNHKKASSGRFSFKATEAEAEKMARVSNQLKGQVIAEQLKNSIFQGWVTIQSKELSNKSRFPFIKDDIGLEMSYPLTDDFKLLNKKWHTDHKEIPSEHSVYLRLTGPYIYFTNTKTEINILGFIDLKGAQNVNNLNDKENCFVLNENEAMGKATWKICAQTQQELYKWICFLTVTIEQGNLETCTKAFNPTVAPARTVKRQIIQPYVIIPIPQQHCNANWDYLEHGQDWNCLCKDGREQSPIDLPPPEKAVDSPAKPLFEYNTVNKKHLESRGDGKAREGTPVRIEHDHNCLRIFHKNMGRVVTMDGTVYLADEIVFHTPSEHTIDGVKYPMEVQVKHKAVTKGDYGKQVILSFLFKAKAGIYNKFIEQIDSFSLPSPGQKTRDLFENFFIPNLLLSSEDDELNIMQPFSFYTYQGSLPEPPCSENVVHYVASEPIELGMTALEMFREALREKDMTDANGNIFLAKDKPLENDRATQPLNGRTVFHYNHKLYNCPSFKKIAAPIVQEKGHFEKQYKYGTNYFYVDGNKPSGIPGAIVVPDHEASGKV